MNKVNQSPVNKVNQILVSKGNQILVIQTAFLGDLVLSIPFLKRIRTMWPNAHVTVVVRKGLAEFLSSTRCAHTVFEVEKGNQNSYKKLLSESLSKKSFDCVFAIHESFRTTWFVFQISSPLKVAYKKWWNFFVYNYRVQKPKTKHEVLKQLSLLTFFDSSLNHQLQNVTPFQYSASFDLSLKSVYQTSISDIQKNHPLVRTNYICIFPGSVWETKRWEEDRFLKLAQRISSRYQVLFMGDASEKGLCDRLATQVKGALSLAGETTLVQTLAVLSQAQLTISNDSAGQHLAALVEGAVFTIYGPTIPEFGFWPWASGSQWIEPKILLKCRPCGSHGHKRCPLNTHECMKSITVEDVINSMDPRFFSSLI